MKVTIFIVMLVLKSEENIACTSSKLCENGLSQDVFRESGPSFHTSSEFFDDVQYGHVDRILWQKK